MPTTLDSADLASRWAGPVDPGTPTIVLLHGLGDSGDCWPDAVRRWSPRYRVVGLDLLGHGHSPRFSPAQLAADDPMEEMYAAAETAVARLASAHGGPVLLVSHSMGGGIAGALAARRADLVAAAVLEDPAWRDPEFRVQPREVVTERIEECRAWAADPEPLLAKGRAENPAWPDAEFEPWARSKAQVDLGFLELGVANLVQPWWAIVEAIEVPTLVLLAEHDGPVVPEVRERAAGIGNPHVAQRVVPGTGHCIRRDDADAYHALVDPFLAEHAERVPTVR